MNVIQRETMLIHKPRILVTIYTSFSKQEISGQDTTDYVHDYSTSYTFQKFWFIMIVFFIDFDIRSILHKHKCERRQKDNGK